MRGLFEAVDVLILQVDVGIDEVLAEHAARREEGVIGLQAVESGKRTSTRFAFGLVT